ncbi:hypothetical protein UK14_28090, partial [Streptomyces sp. NRRL F-4428]
MHERVFRFSLWPWPGSGAAGGAGPRTVVVHAVPPLVVGDLAAGAAAGEPGLGPDRAAQPAGRLGRVGGVGCASAALQQPDPYGLFEVGGVHSGARGLRRGLRGEQRAQFGDDEVGVLQQVHAERDEWV